MLYHLPPSLTLRTIDPVRDADLCAANHYDACLASFGERARYEGRDAYLRWLKPKVEEYPEGFMLAFHGDDFIGQLEMEVPYGLSRGYVSLFYVSPDMRGRGYGRLLHDYADRYFRAWDAEKVELHVSPRNIRAIRFYRKLGYNFCNDGEGSYLSRDAKLWKMSRPVVASTSTTVEENGSM